MEAEAKDRSPAESLPVALLTAMDRAYEFTLSNNAEIKFRWQSLCIRSGAAWIVPHAFEFITSQGRMKYVRPLYRALRVSDICGKQKVDELFQKYKDS